MLRKIILLMVLLSGATFTVFANTIESPLFYESLPIVKIYSMSEGYRIIYQSPDGTTHDLYVPISWFGTQSGKAILIAGSDLSYPYMSVFYLNGKFDYIKIYVKSSYNDPSWGILPPGFDAKGKFPTDNTLSIKWQ